MHHWNRAEQRALKCLVSSSAQPYASSQLSEVATNSPADRTCGWSKTRSCPVYTLHHSVGGVGATTGKRILKQQHLAPVGGGGGGRGGVAGHLGGKTDHDYMSGTLTEDFRYFYKGGVSSRGAGAAMHELQGSSSSLPVQQYPPPAYHKQTLALDLQPLMAYRSSQMDAKERTQLANIVAMQMKPELLIEQLIIENRLKTMSLSSFPVLEVKGKQNSHSSMPLSHSSPALAQQQQAKKTRKNKRKSRPPLEWCALGNSKQQAVGPNTSDLSPLLGVGRVGPTHSLTASIQPQRVKAKWTGDGLAYSHNDSKDVWSPSFNGSPSSSRCPLHVVMPSLEPEPCAATPVRFKHHTSKLGSLAMSQPLQLRSRNTSDQSYLDNPS